MTKVGKNSDVTIPYSNLRSEWVRVVPLISVDLFTCMREGDQKITRKTRKKGGEERAKEE